MDWSVTSISIFSRFQTFYGFRNEHYGETDSIQIDFFEFSVKKPNQFSA